eukprot:bmy_10048T0
MDIENQVQVLARKYVGLEFSLEVIGNISVLVNDALTCAWEVGRGGDEDAQPVKEGEGSSSSGHVSVDRTPSVVPVAGAAIPSCATETQLTLGSGVTVSFGPCTMYKREGFSLANGTVFIGNTMLMSSAGTGGQILVQIWRRAPGSPTAFVYVYLAILRLDESESWGRVPGSMVGKEEHLKTGVRCQELPFTKINQAVVYRMAGEGKRWLGKQVNSRLGKGPDSGSGVRGGGRQGDGLANTHLSAKIKLKAHPQTEAACTFVFIFIIHSSTGGRQLVDASPDPQCDESQVQRLVAVSAALASWTPRATSLDGTAAAGLGQRDGLEMCPEIEIRFLVFHTEKLTTKLIQSTNKQFYMFWRPDQKHFGIKVGRQNPTASKEAGEPELRPARGGGDAETRQGLRVGAGLGDAGNGVGDGKHIPATPRQVAAGRELMYDRCINLVLNALLSGGEVWYWCSCGRAGWQTPAPVARGARRGCSCPRTLSAARAPVAGVPGRPPVGREPACAWRLLCGGCTS